MTTITMTKKIEVYIDGSQEERDSFFDFFWKNSREYVKALNMVYKQLMFEELIKEAIKEMDQGYAEREKSIQERIEKLVYNDPIDQKKLDKAKAELSKLRNEKNKEARDILTQAIGLKSQTRTRDVAKKVDFDFSDFIDSANMKASKDFGNDFIGIISGQRTPRIYKNKNKYGLLPFRGRDIKIHKADKFYISIPKGFRFKVNLGSKPRKARDVASVLQHIVKGDYKLNQSNLIFDGRKLFFALTFSFEKSYNEVEFNEGTELIVNFLDLCSGECLINNQSVMSFGDSQYIRNFKSKIKALKSKEQSRGVFAKGGHGRKRKLDQDRWEAIKSRESNFVKTYNNQCSAKIVKTAIRNKAQVICISEPDKAYGEWAYYQLKEQLVNKGKRYGIEVKSI
ncbi:hypothetical protein EB20_02755 [Enterococcus hirae]|nr:hypothetical protein EB50_01150 [Enterococcus faecium]RBT46186.1 hypothetical protein EB20_02755 [Enterococcus hirae]RBT46688.1 hypothetical protein EB10_02840 [Enterococcus hirae]RBT51471.1 hypothetical protein EB24_02874 [Enterococcus hirae]RBT57635.1 hypothetical protein EB39_02887 [Enterococcus hirae]